MLITPLVLVAAMAATPSQTVDTARAAYTKCLRSFMLTSLKAKMPTAQFGVAVKDSCTTEQSAFHTAVVAFNRSSGDSAADAKENADMQVEDYIIDFTEKFTDYTDSGTMPAEG